VFHCPFVAGNWDGTSQWAVTWRWNAEQKLNGGTTGGILLWTKMR
jgi:hypothetical protein